MDSPDPAFKAITVAEARVLVQAAADRLASLCESISDAVERPTAFDWPTIGDLANWGEEVGAITRIAARLLADYPESNDTV